MNIVNVFCFSRISFPSHSSVRSVTINDVTHAGEELHQCVPYNGLETCPVGGGVSTSKETCPVGGSDPTSKDDDAGNQAAAGAQH